MREEIQISVEDEAMLSRYGIDLRRHDGGVVVPIEEGEPMGCEGVESPYAVEPCVAPYKIK